MQSMRSQRIGHDWMTRVSLPCVEPLIFAFLCPWGSQTPVPTVSSAQTCRAGRRAPDLPSGSAFYLVLAAVYQVLGNLALLPASWSQMSWQRWYIYILALPLKRPSPHCDSWHDHSHRAGKGQSWKVTPNAFDGSPLLTGWRTKSLTKPCIRWPLFPVISYCSAHQTLCSTKSFLFLKAFSLAAGPAHALSSLLRMFFLTFVGLFSKS